MRCRFCVLHVLGVVLLVLAGCRQHPLASGDALTDEGSMARCGALLLTRFGSFQALKDVVRIDYAPDLRSVTLRHACGDRVVTSTLSAGITEKDFIRARGGSLGDKARILGLSPFAVLRRRDLVRIEILGRRRPMMFGEGDVAFYDIASRMVDNILPLDTLRMSPRDLSEKGYLNTFNHVMAQAFMTTLYGERVADFVADVHERHAMPELISGRFTSAQLADLDTGPLDNYLDIINNEWGQELGKALRAAYSIDRETLWTPDLLADYLNAIQQYHGWIFGIGFSPFRPHDLLVIRFADKINRVNASVDQLQRIY